MKTIDFDTNTSVILRPKKSRLLLLMLVSAVFVAGGIWMGRDGSWIGYVCAGFFTLGILVSIVELFWGTHVTLDRTGLAICAPVRKSHYAWDDIEEFLVVEIKQAGLPVHKMVGFNFVETYDRSRRSRAVAKAIGGCEGALPDTFGYRPEQLAALLNECLINCKSLPTRPSNPPETS
ncbi:MAG: hypothetical protein ACYS8Z_09450 [Planctomycetota bacterium]